MRFKTTGVKNDCCKQVRLVMLIRVNIAQFKGFTLNFFANRANRENFFLDNFRYKFFSLLRAFWELSIQRLKSHQQSYNFSQGYVGRNNAQSGLRFF